MALRNCYGILQLSGKSHKPSATQPNNRTFSGAKKQSLHRVYDVETAFSVIYCPASGRLYLHFIMAAEGIEPPTLRV